MDNERIILSAISDLSSRMEHRFDKVDEKFISLEDRTLKAERDIIKVKTVSGIAAGFLGFVGWDHIKLWLTALTK